MRSVYVSTEHWELDCAAGYKRKCIYTTYLRMIAAYGGPEVRLSMTLN